MFRRVLYTHAVNIRTYDLQFTSGQETHWLYQLNVKQIRKMHQYILTIEKNQRIFNSNKTYRNTLIQRGGGNWPYEASAADSLRELCQIQQAEAWKMREAAAIRA